MKRLSFALAHALVFSGAFALMATPAMAGGGMGGGSLEVTTLANNAELVQNAANTLNTVRNTLQSSLYLEQELKQLDPATLANLVGFPVQEVTQMAGLYNQLTSTMNAYQQFQAAMGQFQVGMAGANMSPGQYLNYLAQAAQQYGGVYRQQLQTDQQVTQNLQQQNQALQQTAASIPNVTSSVGGLQQLLAQNVQVQSLLVSLNQGINQSNQMAALRGQDEANATAAVLNHQQLSQANYAAAQANAPKSTWNLPDPTQVPIGGGQ